MITFDKLFITMEKKHKSGYNLLRENVIGGGTLARMKQGKSISTDTINSLCNYLHCKPMDIMSYSPDKLDPGNPGNTTSGDGSRQAHIQPLQLVCNGFSFSLPIPSMIQETSWNGLLWASIAALYSAFILLCGEHNGISVEFECGESSNYHYYNDNSKTRTFNHITADNVRVFPVDNLPLPVDNSVDNFGYAPIVENNTNGVPNQAISLRERMLLGKHMSMSRQSSGHDRHPIIKVPNGRPVSPPPPARRKKRA